MKIIVVGGGAAGFFAAITCAEANPKAEIVILERGKEVLQKVRISGGGRCNVTNACTDAAELAKNYPRGGRELLGPFKHFGTSDTVNWFQNKGVILKAEEDGRMFPTTDNSATIVNCLLQTAQKHNIRVETGIRLMDFSKMASGKYRIQTQGNPTSEMPKSDIDKLVLTSGSSTAMWDLLAEKGHKIVPPVPSLFTFNTKDTRLRELSGLSVPNAKLQIPELKHAAQGPLLVTHWGLSGPAILRLSAWGARDLQACEYRFSLIINWLGNQNMEDVLGEFAKQKNTNGKKQVRANALFGLPMRLWQNLFEAANLPTEIRFGDLNKQNLQDFGNQLTAANFLINGKSTFKEEFVTAGGIDLKEVNFKRFESKLFPNLFFAGEILNIDAITGGFNFQAAWTGGYLAGLAMGG